MNINYFSIFRSMSITFSFSQIESRKFIGNIEFFLVIGIQTRETD